MENSQTPRRERRRRRGLLALLMAGTALISATGATMSLAQFTSQASVGGNAFTAGTIVLTTNPTTALLTANPIMPGDTVNGSLVVTNGGTGDLRYAISADSTTTLALNTVILITIKTADTAGGTTCNAWTGTTIFGGAGGAAISNAAMAAIVGNPAQGPDAGDRTLLAGNHETLCFRAVLPLATLNAFQAGTATYTFQFDAEQTKNNP